MYIIHISIDGLTPGAILKLGENQLKNIFRIRKGGIITDNARTDFYLTTTLPNHTCMFTGRPTCSMDGHCVCFNRNIENMVIHDINGKYVESIFDRLAEYGKTSAIYAGKNKFEFICRSYSHDGSKKKYVADTYIDQHNSKIYRLFQETRGAINRCFINRDFKKRVGENRYIYTKKGVNLHFNHKTENNFMIGEKIINVDIPKQLPIVQEFIKDFKNNPYTYSFIHFSGTDKAGHRYGWDSEEYLQSLRAIDDDLGAIVDLVDEDEKTVYLILTSDHGGGGGPNHRSTDQNKDGTRYHSDYKNHLNFTIPFYVYRKKGFSEHDLYRFNNLVVPGKYENPDYLDAKQPIRNGHVANLVLSLLNLPPIGTIRGLHIPT